MVVLIGALAALGIAAALAFGIGVGQRRATANSRVTAVRASDGPADTSRPNSRARADAALAMQVLEALGEGVVVVDRGDLVLLANPAAHALGALSTSPAAGQRLSTDALRRVAHAAIDTGAVQLVHAELPQGYLGRDLLNVAVSAVPLGADAVGRTPAVALLLTDTTETRRLEAVRRDFVANVSHELKTPVGALTLLAEAVQSAADDPVAVDRFAGRMQHEGQRLGRLVGELIALSRVQGADALPEVKTVDVRRVFAEAVDRTRLAADRVGITMTCSVPDGLAVLGDEAQLTTAVANLADNAVSYSPNGTKVVLSARAVPDGADRQHYAELSVTDQGIGIAEGDRDRIFERFYRVDPARSRATGGTGLGLAIVKHIATNHGGSVYVWSSEGSGSTFTIRVPRATQVGPGNPAAGSAPADLVPADLVPADLVPADLVPADLVPADPAEGDPVARSAIPVVARPVAAPTDDPAAMPSTMSRGLR